MIQLYGNFQTNFSHGVVSRGMAYGLRANGLTDLQVYNIHRYGGYTGLSEPVAEGGYGIQLSSGWQESAPVGIFIGGYPPQSLPWIPEHPFKAALFITESEVVPSVWISLASSCDLLMFPSRWAADAFLKRGVEPKKVHVVPHGLHPTFHCAMWRDVPIVEPKPLNLLHICGAADFMDRKGTPQLVTAVRELRAGGLDVRLTIRVVSNPKIHALLRKGDAVTVADAPQGLSPVAMRNYLLSGAWDAVIQPSRSEAFGIVPVEARALGIPVILSAATGHLEHIADIDTKIEVGISTPLATNFIPGGMAPTVTTRGIVSAIERFAKNREALHRDAKNLSKMYFEPWHWPRLCAKVSKLIKKGKSASRSKSTLADKQGIG